MNRPTNFEHLQDNNLQLLLELLRDNETMTRQDMVEKTGLSASGISRLVSFLVDKGLVVEDNVIARKKGRRAITLKLNDNSLYCVGVRLARNYIKCGLFNTKGQLLYGSSKIITSGHLSEVTSVLDTSISETLNKAKGKGIDVFGIGISAPGPLFAYEGRIVLTSNFPEWSGFSIKDFVETRFEMRTYVEHDANVSVLAERWFGKGKGIDNLVYVVVDRGVGAGIISNGVLYQGHHNIAGEIGHTTIDYNGPRCECGNRGCLEMYCSSHAVVKQASEIFRKTSPPGWHEDMAIDDLFEQAYAGEVNARRLISNAGTFLGIGLVNLINTYNPARIILGDEMTRAGELWLEAVRSAVRKRTLPEVYSGTDIEMSELEIEPAFLGTGTLVIRKAFENVSQI